MSDSPEDIVKRLRFYAETTDPSQHPTARGFFKMAANLIESLTQGKPEPRNPVKVWVLIQGPKATTTIHHTREEAKAVGEENLRCSGSAGWAPVALTYTIQEAFYTPQE